MDQTVKNVLSIMLVLTSIWSVYNCLDQLFNFVSKIFNGKKGIK